MPPETITPDAPRPSLPSKLIPIRRVPRIIGKMLANPDLSPHINSVMRWLMSGRLHAVRIGGRWYTSREWINSFIQSNERYTSPEIRTPARRQRAIEDADRRLTARGL